MKKSIFPLTLLTIVATTLLSACSKKQTIQDNNSSSTAISLHQNAPGDSTIYGLACDGCTDSILVFLPYAGGDPDTFDIIEAEKQHHVFGRTHIGDELALLTNPENHHEALMVINVNELQGMWCCMVTPTLRHSASGTAVRQLPDSILKRLMAPREYGLRLKRDYTAYSIGNALNQTTTDDMSPVEYPASKHYTEWCIYNGRIILRADTIPGVADQPTPENDTVSVVLLHRDSLVLRFADHEQGYYRKREERQQSQ